MGPGLAQIHHRRVLDMQQAGGIGAINLDKAGATAVLGVAGAVVDADAVLQQHGGGLSQLTE